MCKINTCLKKDRDYTETLTHTQTHIHIINWNVLAEVAGSLIAYVRAELSMRALESAYLNGVSRGKRMSYRFSLSGEPNANQTLRCVCI